jgi:5-methylcytosine-specific restriction endonuclease McrA
MKAREERLARQREAMRVWRQRNREVARTRNRDHYSANRQPYLDRAALQRSGAKEAAPQWLTKQHWEAIAEVYAIAQRLTVITGVLHVVDHVWPLKGARSCGLHVPWNLQVITHAFNVAKGSKEPSG